MDIVLFGVIFLAFFLAGEAICGLWRHRFASPAECFIFSTTTGLIFFSCVTTCLALLRIITPVSAWIFLTAVYLLRRGRCLQLIRSIPAALKAWPSRFHRTSPGWFDWFNLSVLAVLVFFALTLALAPPVRTDALVYHLAVPKAFLEHQGIINLPNNIYSFFPQQMEMIFLFCLALKGDALAQLTGLGLTLLLLLGLTLYFKQTFSSRYASFVPVLYFSTPTFFLISPAAYVDTHVAAFIFLAFYAWDRWGETDQTGWFYLVVLFTASATATKLTAVISLPLVFLGILLKARRGPQQSRVLKHLVIFAGATLLLMLPWWTRNYFFTGNPLAPYFLQVFGGSERFNWDLPRSLAQHQYYLSFGMGRGLIDFLLLPFNLTFFSEPRSLKFDGQIGILFFLLLPAWFGLRKKALPLVTLFFIFLIFWFVNFQYIRLLAPAFTFLTLIATAGFERLTRADTLAEPANPSTTRLLVKAPALQSLIAFGVALGVVFNLVMIGKEWMRIQPLPFLMAKETRSGFWTRHFPSYPLFEFMNDKLDSNAVVLFVFMQNLGYLSERKFISDTFFEAHTLQSMLERDASLKGLAHQLRSREITHLLFDNNYVFGRDSAFSPEQQTALKEFLRARADLVASKNGFYLYRFVIN